MFRIPPVDLVDPATPGPCEPCSRERAGSPMHAPAGVIEAITRDVFGHPVDAVALEPISFDEVARDVVDARFRRQLVGAAIALGLTIHPPDPAGRGRDARPGTPSTSRSRCSIRSSEPRRGTGTGCRGLCAPQLGDERSEARGPRARRPRVRRAVPRMKGHGSEDTETIRASRRSATCRPAPGDRGR